MKEIKKSKFFVILSLTIFIGLCLVFVVIYHLLVSKDIKISHSYKQFLLEHTKGQRLIVDSGSNSQHSINSMMLEERLGILTINISDNGGYPLKQKLLRIERYSHAGDIVLLPLEWAHYSYKDTSKQFLYHIFDRLNFYYNSLPLLEKFALIINTPFPAVVQASLKDKRFSGGSLASRYQDEYIQLKSYEKRFHNNDRADYKYTGPVVIADDGTKTKTCNEYVLEQQIKSGFSISDVFKDNMKIVKRLQKNGIKVVFTWPTVNGDNCYGEKEEEKFKAFVTEIKAYMLEQNIPFIGEPEDSHFPRKYMLNTYYHVNAEARDIRTKKLIENLENSIVIDWFKVNRVKPYMLGIKSNGLSQELLNSLNETKDNKTIIFSKKHFSNAFLAEGWSPIETGFVWSDGNKSVVYIKLDDNLRNNNLKMHITSYMYKKNDKTELLINEKSIGSFLLHGNKEITLSKELVKSKDGLVKIEFHHSNVKSPYEYGVNKDYRKLKLRLVSMKFVATEAL